MLHGLGLTNWRKNNYALFEVSVTQSMVRPGTCYKGGSSMIGINRFHVLRILLCSVFTVFFIKTTSVIVSMNFLFLLVYTKTVLDLGIDFDASVNSSLIWFLWFFYWFVCFVVVVVVWKWFGIPERLGLPWFLRRR